MSDDPREERLPKWAQAELATLRMRLEEARAELAKGPDTSDSFADPYGEVPRPLGMDARVEFGSRFHVAYDSGSHRLLVRSSWSRLAVLPFRVQLHHPSGGARMKRSPMPLRSAPLARTVGLARTGRPKARAKRPVPGRVEAAAAFRAAVLAEPCVMCRATGPRDAHHAVPAAVLRRIARSRRLSDEACLAPIYASEVGVALCAEYTPGRCHERHTSAVCRVPADRIPQRVWTFAGRVGPEAVAALEREHPEVER